ncbi:4392_t:CDS:2 [Diversispora eburnea]|uniref:4392_t:CDS:1 n=1 Tax=Diversispora eburnea TaxID=1213867 RepID=A0A9N9F6J6_9GLOM|nr:4392_t:CDS:2 [Diversispora eburnea]
MAWIQKKPIFAILLFSMVLFTIVSLLFANEQITSTDSTRHRYIITLHQNTTKEHMEEMEDTLIGLGAVIIHKYTIVMKGWAVEMSDSLVSSLEEDESVESFMQIPHK